MNAAKAELEQAELMLQNVIDIRTEAVYKLELAEELAKMYAERYDIADKDPEW